MFTRDATKIDNLQKFRPRQPALAAALHIPVIRVESAIRKLQKELQRPSANRLFCGQFKQRFDTFDDILAKRN